jgi:alpha-mannosidase
MIVRLYESHRKRATVRLRFAFAVRQAWQTNLLEENKIAFSVEGNSVCFHLRPYQIMTMRVKGAPP